MISFNKLFEEYKALNYLPSVEDYQKVFIEYVYSTNKLEGNKLSLNQTTSLIEKGKVSGYDIKLHDILEQRGMAKALDRIFDAINNKEALSVNLLIEINWLILGSLWKDGETFKRALERGQEPNKFKQVENLIKIIKHGQDTYIIKPLSNSENVEENMKLLVNQINLNTQDCIEKGAFLAQEIWLHQPFIDGNKRTGRLLINWLTMKEGFPLFNYETKGENYNNLLIEQYETKKPGLIKNYIKKKLTIEMKKKIDMFEEGKKNVGKGYRFLL